MKLKIISFILILVCGNAFSQEDEAIALKYINQETK